MKSKVSKAAVISNVGNSVRNKTGGWRLKRPVVDVSKCIGCGKCWVFCPDNAISLKKKKKACVDYDYCKGCGICATVCPVGAIKIVKEEK